MDSNRGSARDGKKSKAKGSISFEAFQPIFSDVVRELNASIDILEGEADGGACKKVVTVSIPEAARSVRVNLQHLHRTLECEAPMTEERCAEALRSQLKTLAASEPLPISSSDVPKLLASTVKTRSFMENFESNGEFFFTRTLRENGEEWPSSPSMDSESLGATKADSASKEEDHFAFQSLSCRSGELVRALILEMPDYDFWITDTLLQDFGLSASSAFEIAVKNLGDTLPFPLERHFAIWGSNRDMEASNKRLKQNRHDICFVKAHRWGPICVWVRFEDQRTLSRMILPRFIEFLAGGFGCNPTSMVVIPFSKCELFAGNCESSESMWFLGEPMALERNKAMIANPSFGHVSTRPYRVTKLRNDQGLVELEPYPVWGGTLGLHIWEGPVRKCLYPVPKTRDESDVLDPYMAEERGYVCETVSESLCFADVCWNCRKKPEGAKLLKCANCGDVKYCSKACQKFSWQKDHKLECDARKQAAQGSSAVKTGEKKKTVQKTRDEEIRERLAQTIAENLRDVNL